MQSTQTKQQSPSQRHVPCARGTAASRVALERSTALRRTIGHRPATIYPQHSASVSTCKFRFDAMASEAVSHALLAPQSSPARRRFVPLLHER
eukprot:667034-Prymnesium_polylepis.1